MRDEKIAATGRTCRVGSMGMLVEGRQVSGEHVGVVSAAWLKRLLSNARILQEAVTKDAFGSGAHPIDVLVNSGRCTRWFLIEYIQREFHTNFYRKLSSRLA